MLASALQSIFPSKERRNQSPAAHTHSVWAPLRAFLLIGAAVFVATAIGLASSELFALAFWPANALLVGLMLRNPRLNRPFGWHGAAAGYIGPELIFGQMSVMSIVLAGASLVGSMTATVLLRRLDRRDLRLRRVHSVLRLLAAVLPSCAASAIIAATITKITLDTPFVQTLSTWLVTELVNYLTVLPAILTVPTPQDFMRRVENDPDWRRPPLWPALILFLSCVAAVSLDGPGSIMFPVPALLLCALTYTVPVTAVLTMALGTGCLVALGLGNLDIGQDLFDPATVLSTRVAVAFLVLVPLTIASAMAVRDDLLAQLRRAADHDGLTKLLNRRAFEQRLTERLRAGPAPGRGLAILWLDIDHFKSINDQHGHMAGDAVLVSFAETARNCCRAEDIVGRWGGEEFALLVEVADRKGAEAVAERLRATFEEQPTLWEETSIPSTISIGACYLDKPFDEVPELILQLDQALYRAKRNGRNRIEWLPLAPRPENAAISDGRADGSADDKSPVPLAPPPATASIRRHA